MTGPCRLLGEGRTALDLSRGIQYVVRETDAERAEEISGEFYPNGKAAAGEPGGMPSDKVRETSSSHGFTSWRVGFALTMPRRRC